MKQTVSEGMFRDAFTSGQYKNNFSYYGLTALFEHLEQYEESTGDTMEFDVVGIACEFSEYATAKMCAINYLDFTETDRADLSEEEVEKEALEWLGNMTTIIEFDGGIIIQDF